MQTVLNALNNCNGSKDRRHSLSESSLRSVIATPHVTSINNDFGKLRSQDKHDQPHDAQFHEPEATLPSFIADGEITTMAIDELRRVVEENREQAKADEEQRLRDEGEAFNDKQEELRDLQKSKDDQDRVRNGSDAFEANCHGCYDSRKRNVICEWAKMKCKNCNEYFCTEYFATYFKKMKYINRDQNGRILYENVCGPDIEESEADYIFDATSVTFICPVCTNECPCGKCNQPTQKARPENSGTPLKNLLCSPNWSFYYHRRKDRDERRKQRELRRKQRNERQKEREEQEKRRARTLRCYNREQRRAGVAVLCDLSVKPTKNYCKRRQPDNEDEQHKNDKPPKAKSKLRRITQTTSKSKRAKRTRASAPRASSPSLLPVIYVISKRKGSTYTGPSLPDFAANASGVRDDSTIIANPATRSLICTHSLSSKHDFNKAPTSTTSNGDIGFWKHTQMLDVEPTSVNASESLQYTELDSNSQRPSQIKTSSVNPWTNVMCSPLVPLFRTNENFQTDREVAMLSLPHGESDISGFPDSLSYDLIDSSNDQTELFGAPNTDVFSFASQTIGQYWLADQCAKGSSSGGKYIMLPPTEPLETQQTPLQNCLRAPASQPHCLGSIKVSDRVLDLLMQQYEWMESLHSVDVMGTDMFSPEV